MIEVINNLPAIRNLEPEWVRLGSKFDTPLLQFDWFLACAETLCHESNLRIVVFKSRGQIKAIAPLVLCEHPLVNWLEILGGATLHEPAGLLYDNQESLDELLKGVISIGLPVNLNRIPDTAPILRRLKSIARGRAFSLSRPSAGSYYISSNTDWDTFHSHIGKKWRADFRNKKRRAEKLGNITVDIFHPREDQWEAALNQAIEIEAESWKGKQGSSIRDIRSLRDFIYSYAGKSCKSGILIICFFSINDNPIAMNLGVKFANKLWFLKTGYNDNWSRVSPGMQLNMESIRYTFQNKLDGYEFLGSEEAWQQAWPVETHKYSSLVIFPYTIKGILGFSNTVLTYAKNRLLKSS